jgi:hypothetical protein
MTAAVQRRRIAPSCSMADSVPSKAPRALVCARCGGAFDCSLDGDCWCAAEPYRLPVVNAGKDCLCPSCLRRDAAATR